MKHISLHQLVFRSNILQIKLYLRENIDNINMQDSLGRTALHIAVIYSNKIALKVLLNRGIDSNKKTYADGKTALHLAVELSNQEAVKILIKHKQPDVDAQDNNGYTALHFALYSNSYLINEDAFDLMVKRGANVELKTSCGKPVLHLAAERLNYNAIRRILNAGGDIDVRDTKGFSLLHYAVTSRNFNLINMVMDEGINSVMFDKNGKTALQLAEENGDTECVEFLLTFKTSNFEMSDMLRVEKRESVINTMFRYHPLTLPDNFFKECDEGDTSDDNTSDTDENSNDSSNDSDISNRSDGETSPIFKRKVERVASSDIGRNKNIDLSRCH